MDKFALCQCWWPLRPRKVSFLSLDDVHNDVDFLPYFSDVRSIPCICCTFYSRWYNAPRVQHDDTSFPRTHTGSHCWHTANGVHSGVFDSLLVSYILAYDDVALCTHGTALIHCHGWTAGGWDGILCCVCIQVLGPGCAMQRGSLRCAVWHAGIGQQAVVTDHAEVWRLINARVILVK